MSEFIRDQEGGQNSIWLKAIIILQRGKVYDMYIHWNIHQNTKS